VVFCDDGRFDLGTNSKQQCTYKNSLPSVSKYPLYHNHPTTHSQDHKEQTHPTKMVYGGNRTKNAQDHTGPTSAGPQESSEIYEHTRAKVNARESGYPSRIDTAVTTESSIQHQLNAEQEQASNSEQDARSTASSELSDAPASPLTDFEDEDAPAHKDSDEDFGLDSDSSQFDDPNDTTYPSRLRRACKTPLGKVNVRDIEDALDLTRRQGDALHNLIQEEMSTAGLLGTTGFKTNERAQNKEALQPTLDKAKADLEFLSDERMKKLKVGKKRLDRLLLVRAMIVNQNEKQNLWNLRVSRVKRRAGEAPVNEEEQGDEAVAAEQVDEDVQLPAVELGERGDRPSVVIASALSVLEIEDELIFAMAEDEGDIAREDRVDIAREDEVDVAREDEVDITRADEVDIAREPDAPGSPMQIDALTRPPSPTEPPTAPTSETPISSSTVIFPTAFLIRVINTTTGAAIHTSQLLPHDADASSIDSLSFETFLALVSAQVGIEVRGRISAIVPRFHGIAPYDVKIMLGSEETWRAVLLSWQITRRRMCEFVVEAAAMEG
jgi:hypothetical protein